MAYETLSGSEDGATARAKINALVGGLNSDIPGQIKAVVLAVQEEAGEREKSELQAASDLAAEARLREVGEQRTEASLADLGIAVSRVALAAVSGSRPGSYPAIFTSELAGRGPDLPPLDQNGCVASPEGDIYRVAGAGIVALRAAVWLEPDAFWALRLQFRSLVDATGPNSRVVDGSIQWLDGGCRAIGTSLLRRYSNLRRSDGPQNLTVRVPSTTGDRWPVTPPKGAVFWRPYIRAYGHDGETAIEAIVLSDVTNAGVYAPDVSDLAARMSSLEAVIKAGIPFSTPILPAYAVANLPKPGSPGRKAFASDGRAPNAAGVLEPANGGTGIEVVDNGTTWVITGTNEQVEA